MKPVVRQTVASVPALWLAVLAAVLYYSWPLGYLLNPQASRAGLASELEALHQPYNWVFVWMDVVSGLLVVAVAAVIWQRYRNHHNKALTFGLVGYALFGGLTALDALLPLNCVESEQQCGSLLQQPMTILHGIASIGSVAGLTLSLLAAWWLVRSVHIWLHSAMVAIIAAWAAFGIVTGWLILRHESNNMSQHVFITLCSLVMVVFPVIFVRYARHQQIKTSV